MRTHLLLCFLLVIVITLACIFPIPDDDPQPPRAPDNLKTLSITATNVVLQWEDNSKDEAGFRVWRDNNLLGTTSTTRYTDDTVDPNTDYRYRVEAYNDLGARSSKSITVSTPSENEGPEPSPGKPKPPSNLFAENDFHQIKLSWKDNADNETHYVVERSGLKKELDPDTENFTDENLESNKTYSYNIYAKNDAGDSKRVSINVKTRGSFEVRWNRAKDRKEVDGQLVENGWAESYELTVEPQDGSNPYVAYSGSDTVFTVVIDKPFCASVVAIDGKKNKSEASKKVCSQ
jgi:hypothetical protein